MRALRIAIDASRTTVARRTGTENYALQLIRALLTLETRHHFILFFRDNPPPDLVPLHRRVTVRVLRSPRLWTHARFAFSLWRTRPDVTFVPAHSLPFWFPGPGVVTIHDLGYIYFPGAHRLWARRYLDWSTQHSAHRATQIVTDSLATAADLAAHYQVPQDRIKVVYPGVDQTLRPVTDSTILAAVREKYGLPPHYLLFVGTLQPRKNIDRIAQAYAMWRRTQPATPCALVMAGQRGWLFDPAWTSGVEGVVLPGYVQDKDIAALYSGALALLFPSLHEGFGFPVLEAMRCGTPVITSNTSSLPEVAGDAALLVDPRDVSEIAAAIGRVTSDDELRTDLIARGLRHSQQFTWERAARQTLHVLESAARR